ncbi:MAG TPA: DUF3073 domain-containing protein [Jatrophihabitantaceae bacterium]|jgi:phage terminase small subunit|nr:DUF3073 domain-containing protein [Jatrophihabitantaceae bacterium]
MGRGRAKAKQQKVARELKYSGQFTDLEALQRELGAHPSSTTDTVDPGVEYDDQDDDWSANGS